MANKYNKRNLIRLSLGIFLLSTALATVYAQSEWLVSHTEPEKIGEKVSEGRKNDVDADWVAPVGGQLQTVFWNNDPNCGEKGVTLEIDRDGIGEVYPVPTAPYQNGDCRETVAALYASRSFEMYPLDKARAVPGDDSVQYWFYFATNTPTSTPTETAIATNTPTATDTATSTPTQTATDTPEATQTATSTQTPVVEPPETALPTNTPTPTDVPTLTPTPTETLVILIPPPVTPTNLEIGDQPSEFILNLPLIGN